MRRRTTAAGAWLLFTLPLALFAVQPADIEKLKEKPITTDGGKVGVLLKTWWLEGTTAGNAGDFYDNRDGDHSPLNFGPYPQLSAIKYSPEEIKSRKHWAAARVVLPHVTFGNSSTSAPAHLGGSNPRSQFVSQPGLSLLYEQYTKNNLYIYPEHRDHDPGHNGAPPPSPSGRGAGGEGGHGDMYPTNTPYLMISQGSSGSDQPFMRMMPYVLAAFRPEVKKKLTETGLLMPTIQMLMRSTNKHLKDPQEYLTGKAHPTVFEGSWVDELAIVQKAHAMELKVLPPMVQLRVLEEDKAENGIDYFDRANSQVLGYTPACIARIHRSRAHMQRLVVSAETSYDINKSKLTYTWVILRGDPDKIKIVPKKDDQSVAEITVAYHERRPVSPGSPLESNRVDIGVFVHNGTYYSAPGFVTIHTLDREARTYNDRGVLLDIAHDMGEPDMRVTDWGKLIFRIFNHPVASNLLMLSKEEKECFIAVLAEHHELNLLKGNRQEEVKSAEAAFKDAKEGSAKDINKKKLDVALKEAANVERLITENFEKKQKRLDDSPRHFVESRLAKLTQDPLFTQKHQDWLTKSRTPANEARIKVHWQNLARYGVTTPNETLTPLLPGKTLSDAKWTKFELVQLEAFHAALLADLAFPGMVQVSYRGNYVDHRLSVPRTWRDVYHYDSKDQCIGWTRYSGDGKQEFNHEGLLIVDKDALGRCAKGRTVRYVQDAAKGFGPNTNPLRMVLGDTMVRYEFDGATDLRGRRVGMEAVK